MVAEYAGMIPALEAAYRAGSPVVHALVSGWPRYAVESPTAQK
jgi:purine nucleoside permease